MSKLLNKTTPTVEDLAKKYNVSVVEVKKQLMRGIKVEKEHTNNAKIAREIALDHIGEKLNYYKRLAKIDEETSVDGVRGLGNITGDPGVGVTDYCGINALAYDPFNGARLEFVNRTHNKLHSKNLFKAYDPKNIKDIKNFMSEGISAGPEREVPIIGDLTGASRKVLKVEDKDPCWKGYRMLGMKKKGNKEVPNCVPKEQVSLPRYTERPTLEQNKYPETTERGIYEDNTNLAGVTPRVPTQNIRQMVQGARTPPMGKPDVQVSDDPNTGSKSISGSGSESSKYAMDRQRHLDLNKDAAAGAKPIGTSFAPIKGTQSAADDMEARRQAGIRGTTDTDTERAIRNIRYGNRDTTPGADGSTGRATSGPTTPGSGKPSPTTPSTTAVSSPETQRTNDIIKGKNVQEDWQKVNRKDKTSGLSQKAVNAYRRENPGSKLQTAVTEKNPKGKRAARRKSFCSRMGGMKKRLTSAKTARDPNSNINKALRRWNCEEEHKYNNYNLYEVKQMETKEFINEAIENIVENDLISMKENLMIALQEKAMEKLEERKKIIASEYFAQ